MASRLARINGSVLFARPIPSPSSSSSSSSSSTLSCRFRRINDLSNHGLTRGFSLTRRMRVTVDSALISQITEAEKQLTGSAGPAQNGPTAKAQAHAGQPLTAQVIHDITQGEKKITGAEEPVKRGPTAVAQSALTSSNTNTTNTTNTTTSTTSSATLDSSTLHKITEKEKDITGLERPVKGGPTAKAQTHANEPITSQALHDITEGEKM
ncbi:uncharacterized protein SETTUDRAFT_167135, partial [Exserohilum turcica Et28A]